MIIEELVGLLGWKIEGDANLKRFQNGMRQTVELAQRAGQALAVVGAAAAAAFTGFTKSVLQTGMQFEKLQLQLEMYEGGVDQAKQRLAWLKEFAVQTPLSLKETTEAYIRMKNFGLDPLDGSMQALVDANSMMGGKQEQLLGIVTALGQAWTKQKLQAEEMNQLNERSIPAWDLLSKATGKTVPQLQKLASTGKLGRKEISLLIKEMGLKAKGASEKIAGTLEAIIDRLGDQWENFKQTINEAGFFRGVQDQLSRLSREVERLDKNGTLKRWAGEISGYMGRASVAVEKVIRNIIKDALQIKEFFDENPQLLGPLKWGLLALLAVAFPTSAAVAAVALAIDDILTYMRGGDSVIGDFIEAMKKIMPSLEGIPDQIKALDFHGVGESLGKAIVEGLSGIGTAIAEKVEDIDWKWVVTQWLGALWAEIQVFRGIGSGIGEAIAEGLKSVGGEITAWFESFLPDWAAEFLDFRKTQQNALTEKATAETERWRKFEQEAPTKRYNSNTPGVKGTFDQIQKAQHDTDQKARFERWGNMAENARINSQRAAGGSPEVLQSITNDHSNRSVTTNTAVTLTVQQITNAANSAATAVRDKVSSALSKVPSHPARTVPTPHF